MPNKHFCQGPHCHTNPTSDTFLKSKGIIVGAMHIAKLLLVIMKIRDFTDMIIGLIHIFVVKAVKMIG